jgi:hypothetical protein
LPNAAKTAKPKPEVSFTLDKIWGKVTCDRNQPATNPLANIPDAAKLARAKDNTVFLADAPFPGAA